MVMAKRAVNAVMKIEYNVRFIFTAYKTGHFITHDITLAPGK